MSELRAALNTRLLAARKAGDRAAMGVVRSALSALDNASAVPVGETSTGAGSEHVAGASVGVGAAEVARRELTDAEERAVVTREAEELEAAATTYDAAGRPDEAAGARDGATLLRSLANSESDV